MSGLLPEPLATMLRPASLVYGLGVARRNRRFDRGDGVEHLPEPVISVGNISVGGTGKTPVCSYVLQVLEEAGHSPALAMRGYRSQATGSADEAEEYRDVRPELSLAVGADRVAALAELRKSDPFDCVVLDDGFQHRRIARDLDLVLVDATRPGLDDRLLPSGRLREPLEALARADAVLVTRSNGVDEELADRLARFAGSPPLAWLEHSWEAIDVHRQGQTVETIGVGELKDQRLAVSFGVGNPGPLKRTVEATGARIVHDHAVRDHHHYTERDVRSLRGHGVDAVMVTGKDWVKLRRLAGSLGDCPVMVPRLSIKALSGEEALRSRIQAAVSRS
ncbi:MAG: tetraacyldisaccharide 4'-kinase [Phycisphaerales bacterium]|nr:tetraacyldisaccharide 4'-kinase [Phycisphaerales bacterium]